MRKIESIKALLQLMLIALPFGGVGGGLLVSCVDYDDAARLVNVKVQILPPSEYLEGKTVDSQTVHIKSTTSGTELSVTTDENGFADIKDCMPDLYDVSVSWELTPEQYKEKTGKESDSAEGYIVTAAINGQAFNDSYEVTPLPLSAKMAMKNPLVISKIYSSGSKDSNNKNYLTGRYLEIYNQSDKPVSISGLYIALLESGSSSARPWTLAQLIQYRGGKEVVAKQIYRVPTDKEYFLEGGKSLVVAISATDHSDINDKEQDLSASDFETAGGDKDNLPHNADVPKLENIYSFIATNYTMNLMQGGPCGVILFQTDEDVTKWENTYGYGKTTGQEYKFVPRDCILDGVDFLKNRTTIGPDPETKRLYSDIDAGYTNINALAGYTGEVVYRKTARVTSDGRKVLRDTNNSSNDFKVSTTIKVREYDDAE